MSSDEGTERNNQGGKISIKPGEKKGKKRIQIIKTWGKAWEGGGWVMQLITRITLYIYIYI